MIAAARGDATGLARLALPLPACLAPADRSLPVVDQLDAPARVGLGVLTLLDPGVTQAGQPDGGVGARPLGAVAPEGLAIGQGDLGERDAEVVGDTGV